MIRTTHLRSLFATLLRLVAIVCVVVGVSASPHTASAQIAAMPKEMEEVKVLEHLDGQLPLDTVFTTHEGKKVRLGDLFDGKRPVVLHFAYHTCPVVCGMITTNIAIGLQGIPWVLGNQYTAITISIDPNESIDTMAKKRQSILAQYGKGGDGWTFLAGDQKAIDAVANAVGFGYQYDPRQKQWAHPSLATVVKPNGRMARYLYGFEFSPPDLRLALLEASEGRHISTVEQIILYCYHYDPQGGKYVIVAQRVMQLGAAAVAAIILSILGLFWSRELVKHRNRKKGPSDSDIDSEHPSDAATTTVGGST